MHALTFSCLLPIAQSPIALKRIYTDEVILKITVGKNSIFLQVLENSEKHLRVQSAYKLQLYLNRISPQDSLGIF